MSQVRAERAGAAMDTDRTRRLAALSSLAVGGVVALVALVGLNLLVFHLLTADRCTLGGCTVTAQVVGDRALPGTSGPASSLGLLADGRVVVLVGLVAATLTALGWWLPRASGEAGPEALDVIATATAWLRLPATLFVVTYVAAATAFWPAIAWIGGGSG
jgi:hypothetical protein